MKHRHLIALASVCAGLSTLPAQASGLMDLATQQFGGGSPGAAASGGGLGALAGGGLAGLAGSGIPGLSASGTASNAAGVITYCMKNNYLNPDKAAGMKNQLLGKMGLGQQEQPKDRGYASGLAGLVTGNRGQSFSLDSLNSSFKEKACDYVLNHASSLL